MPRLRPPLVLAVLLVTGIAGPVAAQVNTGSLRGSVVGEDGVPIEAAEISLVHQPSQASQTSYTNASGEFAFTGLPVGGPYRLTATFEGFRPTGADALFLDAGRTERVSLTLRVAAAEVIEVTGDPTPETTAQRIRFEAADLRQQPSITRDPKDVVQLAPEAYLDGNALSIGGANNRFNSITIDGIRQDDDFGINAGGYPTQRSPIAMNAIEQIAVERSPFDVRYGRFLGGNVNIVTRSGTNEFHGALFGNFANQDLAGDRTGNIDLEETDFREVRYGLNLGGPILRDRLHFFVSLEGLDATTPSSVGPEDADVGNRIEGVTQDDVARVREIARDVYGFDAGEASRSLDEADLKLMTKLDWRIDRRHRLSGKYQRSAGNVVNDAAAFDTTLPLTSNWYDQRDTLHAATLRLNSTWTSSLSTELELAGKLVASRPSALSGNDFTEATIETPGGGRVIIGPDPFRHANRLDNDTAHVKLQADYLLGTHLLLGGVEYDRVWIDNLFAPSSRGEAAYASIEDFAARMPSEIFYGNAVSNDPTDAAARWHSGTVAAYLQDQYAVTSELTVQGGLRFEVYEASTKVRRNPNFVDRYGFDNTATLDGKSIALPRLGVSYRPIRGLNLRTGTGLYSGGTPTVWVSNSYSNDGISLDTAFSDDPAVIGGFDGRQLPAGLTGQLTPGDGNADALDPDFDLPSEWKTSFGADYRADLPAIGPLGVELNYIYANVVDGVLWQDLRRDLPSLADNQPTGTLPDGRPYYDADPTDDVGFDTRRGYDMLLTNTSKGRSHTLSVSATKPLPLGFSVYGGYAYQDVTEVNPATSSRSVSNYGQVAVGDPNDPDVARSNYERRHRLVGALRYSRPLLDDLFGGARLDGLATELGVFVEARSGQPYSYTFGDSAGGDDLAALFGEDREFARRNRQLFYVPRGDGSDVILDGIDPERFDRFLAESGLDRYRGRIVPRNAFTSQWYERIDLRFAQELPGFARGNKARLMVDVQNLGNLLSPRWGRLQQTPFPYTVPVVDVAVDPATGRYIYRNLRTEEPEQRVFAASLWRVQMGLMVEF